LVGKTVAQVKMELKVEDVMKGEKKVKWELDFGSSGWNVGEVSPFLIKEKLR
jgi:hypothetical protein